MRESKETLDLSLLVYDQWLRQVFEHPAGSDAVGGNWYWEHEWALADPPALLGHLTRLCAELSTATDRYSASQINQGIWFLLGACIDVPALLIDPAIPLDCRERCIAAMPGVFSGYVASYPADLPIENGFFMWFDLVASAVTDMPEGTEKEHLADAVLRAIEKVLAIDDVRCQAAALHGVGHLSHPRRRAVVEKWVSRHRADLDEAGAAWVRQCRDGTVM